MKKCIVCGNELGGHPLLSFDDMPASAQDIPGHEQLDKEKGISLTLFECSCCGLVQFDCEPVSYYRDVIRSGGYSTTMHDLRYAQYKHFIETYDLYGKKFLEVGCGQGEFLAVLNEFDVEGYGIEHKEDLVQMAQQKGLRVNKGFMEDEATVIDGAPFDAFLSFNFMEHQPNPNGMLRGIYNNLSENGMGLITVPSLEYILEHDGYYELIRDHIAYYTFDTLRFLLEKNGFVVLEQEMINRDTIAMIVRKRPRTNTKRLHDSYDVICGELNTYIEGLKRKNKKVAIWGASHQGFTIAATAKLSDKIEYIIDSAPFKQGLYSPASHIKIISPDDAIRQPVDAIIIIAPGYTKEITTIIHERFGEDIQVAVLKSSHLEIIEA